MKTTKNRLLEGINIKGIIRITFLSILLIHTACTKNKVSAQDKTNTETPKVDIHTAVLSNNTEAVKEHIKAGSDINEKDKFGGSSPLISAAVFGKTEIAKMLIDAGADLNIQNNDGSTALVTAAFFCRPQIVKMLLEKGADKTLKNNYKQTAYDAVSGDFNTVKPAYEALGKMLEPMGLKLDFAYLEKTRPEIAKMLK